MSSNSAVLTGGMGIQHRSSRGGRRKAEHTRCERVVALSYPEDKRDLLSLCAAWDVPESTLAWAVLHDWLQQQRSASTQLGDELRGKLKAAIELAMRDRELGVWIRGLVRSLEVEG